LAALEDKFDDIKKLIDAGKEKGYLTYDEANELTMCILPRTSKTC
jgi:hypothetical protein